MPKHDPITIERLREAVFYASDTGIFTWKVALRGRTKIGEQAGYMDDHGYVQFGLDGEYYRAHRLAWFYVHGYWPSQIDHVNGIRHDNRIDNLREATPRENSCNCRIYKNSISRHKGVRQRSSGKWEARIRVDGVLIYLGVFDIIEEAIIAYAEAAAKYHGEFART